MGKNGLGKYVLREFPASEYLKDILTGFFEFTIKNHNEPNTNPYFFPNYSTSQYIFLITIRASIEDVVY